MISDLSEPPPLRLYHALLPSACIEMQWKRGERRRKEGRGWAPPFEEKISRRRRAPPTGKLHRSARQHPKKVDGWKERQRESTTRKRRKVYVFAPAVIICNLNGGPGVVKTGSARGARCSSERNGGNRAVKSAVKMHLSEIYYMASTTKKLSYRPVRSGICPSDRKSERAVAAKSSSREISRYEPSQSMH